MIKSFFWLLILQKKLGKRPETWRRRVFVIVAVEVQPKLSNFYGYSLIKNFRFILENEYGISKFLINNTEKDLSSSSTSVILKNDEV